MQLEQQTVKLPLARHWNAYNIVCDVMPKDDVLYVLTAKKNNGILGVFDVEKYKIAKHSFKSTYDANNFLKVVNAFKFYEQQLITAKAQDGRKFLIYPSVNSKIEAFRTNVANKKINPDDIVVFTHGAVNAKTGVPVSDITFYPCLETLRVNADGMAYVYSVVLVPCSHTKQEYYGKAALEIALFDNNKDADSYRAAKWNAYSQYDLKKAIETNKDMIQMVRQHKKMLEAESAVKVK
jgi:hypothetical protein